MPVRVHLEAPLHEGAELTLPPEPSRHIQVLRLQPGDGLTVFNGQGGEWEATVTRMGRQDVDLRICAHVPTARELACPVTIALGMPANERMDALVEKATELGAAAIQPLMCARSVLKLAGDRAEKRRAHWQAVAVAAAEQSGRTRVPTVGPILSFERWLGEAGSATGLRHVLSFGPDAAEPATLLQARGPVLLLSGPEGGLDPREEALARQAGFSPLSLGPRVLRADTAPLAALSLLALAG
ncbi:16S rRNA (uracil(1498)-N(3))-methyltransferase [Ideonella oryzae]|uniref:Ribosomal RNA small subunit methyltransferase E n=1 Tax=Ideonella oryzae TaxID=2937441 RepID=A0ABT1BNH2_9BURK|nr:16S rRNA (uracil(1498)-N(3))-methyltransferase [Ideonella oryzae]MCO5977746.1 16S rRNA (uracil(1498)-N(3))-methyltransferase [Ideonella oryzae]